MQTYTPPQLTKILHVSDDQVRFLIKAGDLVASNISRGNQRARWIVTQESLDEFLRRRQNVKPSKPRKPAAAVPQYV